MLCAKSKRLDFAALAVLTALFAFGQVSPGFAQEPPLTVPAGGPFAYDPNAIALNSWLVYPSLDFFAQNSNNYFLSPTQKAQGWSLGVSPSVTAEWSNGIHSTTIYGNFSHIEYPTDSALLTDDGEATFTQKYSPLRDLTFSLSGDYTHKTIASSLTSAIPSPITAPATTTLPNGNTVLPNGTIISPTGQIVGQVGAGVSAAPFAVVNPYNTFTGTAKAEKIFSDGIVTLGASLLRWDYEEQASRPQDFTAKTFTEDSAFWLGPVFYGYSDGSFTIHDESPLGDSTAYRVIGGIGTRQFGLVRASAYFGHQGTGTSGGASTGGNVYGGALTYYPTPSWTLSVNLDETINLAPAGTPASTQALNISALTPLQIPVSSSTQITASSLRSDYHITPLWTVSGTFAYTRINFLGSPAWDNTWLADATLKYDILRDLTLSWEYQFSSIVSNVPLTSASRSLIAMHATYKF
jgi:hypothetical protein